MRSWVSLNCFMMATAMAAVFFWMSPALAAEREADRIIRPMTALDPVTLQAGDTKITLWGIRQVPPSGVPLQLKALDLLDEMMGNEDVNCRIVEGSPLEVTASCSSHGNSDLGLALLSHGYAVVDRNQISASMTFAPAYLKAQEDARLNEKGIWRLVAMEGRDSRVPAWLSPYLPVMVPLALMIGPLGGLLVTFFMLYYWLHKMTSLQKEEFERASRKESLLQARERYVLLSALEGELNENRNKINAFLSIYNDVLRSLHSTEEMPKYQRVGDIVQKHPSLSKIVFEVNMGKFSLLDMGLAGQVSRLYTSLPTGHEYINLDPGIPLETAVRMVEGVLKEAGDMLPVIDQVIRSLGTAAAAKQAERRAGVE